MQAESFIVYPSEQAVHSNSLYPVHDLQDSEQGTQIP